MRAVGRLSTTATTRNVGLSEFDAGWNKFQTLLNRAVPGVCFGFGKLINKRFQEGGARSGMGHSLILLGTLMNDTATHDGAIHVDACIFLTTFEPYWNSSNSSYFV